MTTTEANVDLCDLVNAVIAAGTAPRGFDGRSARLRDTLLELLTERLTARPPRDADSLDKLLERTLQSPPRVLNPFAGYLEAPSSVIALYQSHGKSIDASAGQAEATFRSLVRDILIMRWPGIEEVVVPRPQRLDQDTATPPDELHRDI